MPDTLPDLVARLRATTPALADVPDEILTAEVARQLQARDGPSVGEAIGVPTFRTSNEKDAGGAAVVRADAVSPWTKAATIGAPGLGARYPLASVGEMLASDNPLKLLAEYVTGPGRPRSVANADPTGIDAFTEGKGPMPLFLGTVEEMSGAGRGLYSRVDDAVSRLPAKGAHPNKIASLLKSNGATAEELAYRQVPEFLASQGNAPVTPDALQAHLDAHPAPLPVVVTHGGEFDIDRELEILHKYGYDVTSEGDFTDEPYLISKKTGNPIEHNADGSFVGQPDKRVPRAVMQAFERIQEQDVSTQTKYAQYQLPGGEQYQETLLTLPKAENPRLTAIRAELDDLTSLPAKETIYKGEDRTAAYDRLRKEFRELGGSAKPDPGYMTSHFDEPNILVHTRSNTRTLPTGEPGRFVEEVQSDWHQAGKEKGYALPAITPESLTLQEGEHSWTVRTPDGRQVEVGKGTVADATEARAYAQRYLTNRATETARVPDAPFKETWPDLGLKQQLLEAAKDPDAQWLGFTSGQTQAARYDLSKQISRVEFDAGDRQLRAFDHGGREVIRQTTGPENLPDYIGKEAAQKLLASTPSLHPTDQTPLYSLSGVDLQVGGEGMRHFYDELLPKRLQKIVKPFGGTVERVPLNADEVAKLAAQNEMYYERGSISEAEYLKRKAEMKQTTPAWIVRLTPAMKARILKEGLPLSLLLGAAAGPSVAEALGGSVSAHDRE